VTKAGPKVLLISQGEFSGVRPALQAALERAGCQVIFAYQNLHALGMRRFFYGAWMKLSALLIYGRDRDLLLERTRAAFVSRSMVCKALVDRHPDLDVVMLIAANSSTYRGSRPTGPTFVIYTDYMNLISKSLPDFGFALEERKPYAEWNRLERQALLEQDHILVMGEHVKPAIERLYGIAPDRISVVGTGPGQDIDIERDGFVKDAYSKNILFVGKIADVKGLDVAIKAFALARETHPDAVLNVVTRIPVSGAGVVSHGSLNAEQLRNLFYAANIFVMPAYKEPLGLVFLEAMWSKAACLGTTTGSMPQIIKDGETGALVEPGDHLALAKHMIAMLDNPLHTRQMGEAGYRAAQAYWHWDGTVQRMLETIG
jgi:glycosyltransferase involved in cell wall biosynthesis